MIHTVRSNTENEIFGATKGRVCEVLRNYWANGEGHYRLYDRITGEGFESPDVFWDDLIPPLDPE